MHIQASHADCAEITMIEDSPNDCDLAPHAPWGFAIYRVAYGAHAGTARSRSGIYAATLRQNRHAAARYQPVVMDNQAFFEGFTSHEVRDPLKGWAADELEACSGEAAERA